MKNLIEMRIGKYERDIAGHPAPSQADGVCRCIGCEHARIILAELKYMKMAERHLSALATPRELAKET